MNHPPQEPNVIASGLVSSVIGIVIATIVISLVVMRAIETYRTRALHGDTSGPAEQMKGVPGEVNAMETRPYSMEAQGISDNERSDAMLGSYGWVDRDRQIVRVPIDTAFDLYLARSRGSGAPLAARRAR